MSKFVIKSEILSRFSKLSTIRLEVKNNRQYIIGYNKYVSVEMSTVEDTAILEKTMEYVSGVFL